MFKTLNHCANQAQKAALIKNSELPPRYQLMPLVKRSQGIGIYTIHQPNDSEGTAPSHRNTQLSFPPPIESRAGSSGNPVLTRGIWIPACAGMTIYSRCVDTYAPGVWMYPKAYAPNILLRPGADSNTTQGTLSRPKQRARHNAACSKRDQKGLLPIRVPQ